MKNTPEGMKEILDQFNKVFNELRKDVDGTDNKNKIDLVRKDMRELLSYLIQSSKEFNPTEFVEKLRVYINKNERLLYSEISGFVNELSEEKDGSKLPLMLSNLDNLYEIQNELSSDDVIKKVIIKLWDHINLSNNQITNLKFSEDKFNDRIGPYTERVIKSEEELENTKKDIYTQLMSMVSIFVAISFVMFGGMSLLNNLFDYSNMASVPLIEMVCGGSLIGFIMIIVMYAFMVFVLRMTGRIDDEPPYKKVVTSSCRILGVIIILTGVLWFINIRNINDVNYINTQCKTVEYDKQTKEVTLVCPASINEENKEDYSKKQ